MTDPIVAAVRFLIVNLEWLRHQAFVDEFLADVDRCVRVVRGLARGPVEQKYLGECRAVLAAEVQPCPDGCGCRSGPRTALSEACTGCFCLMACHPKVASDAEGQICTGDVYAHRGSKVGRCRACGTQHDTATRQAWLDEEVRAYAFTARHIAEAHRIPVKTIRNWANRGQLRTYWRTGAGLAVPWTQPPISAELFGEALEARVAEVKQEIEARGERLHYAGDVLDLATAAAVERAEREAARARRREDAA